ncbi:MAG: dimethyl sulfoxide reductase anchor subunit family protein, partial [Alphaproteobacteria bacterium]
MHPARSVILFTVSSGVGYGMLLLFGILAPLGWYPASRGLGLAVVVTALGLVTLGLLASTFHLGHPERAWRSLSQWRSSWLSREGLASLATYVPALLLALMLFRDDGMRGWAPAVAIVTALFSAATIASTGMIYRSLKPIHQWHNGYVLPAYFAIALMTGGCWLNAFALAWGVGTNAAGGAAVIALAAAALVKLGYWRFIDHTRGAPDAGSATGLGKLGRVRLFESPHSGDSFLLKEMGYHIARKHAAKLRRIAVDAGFSAPLVLTALPLVAGG